MFVYEMEITFGLFLHMDYSYLKGNLIKAKMFSCCFIVTENDLFRIKVFMQLVLWQ